MKVITKIARNMRKDGITKDWMRWVYDTLPYSEGMINLMYLWEDEFDIDERELILDDLEDLVYEFRKTMWELKQQ